MLLQTFKPYPKMKDSDVEWVEEIPEHWEKKKISWSFNKIGSGTTPDSQDDKYYDGDISWVNSGDLNDGIISKTSNYITKKALEDYSVLKVFPKNTLIIAMYGATIGKLGILDIPATTNQACCNLFGSESIHHKFLFYWFLGFKNEIISQGQGGGQPNINQDLIKNLKICVPEIKEQVLIVNFLDYKLNPIDSQIQKNQKLIELLKEKRQATINQAVTKGLDPTVPMKDSGIEWIGDIPEVWKIKRLKFISKFNLSSVDRHQNEGELQVLVCHYPEVYNNEKITKTTILYEGTCSLKEFEKFKLKKDDVLITKDSETPDDIGVPAYVEDDIKNAVCGYHLAQLSTDKNQILGNFLFRFFQSNFANAYFETHANGVTRFGLGKDSIGSIITPLPSGIEQNSISYFLDKETPKIDSLIKKTETQIQKLQEYRQSLIAAAVTGKIDVRNYVVAN